LARIKIIGHEKCPHVNKKSGKNCNKRGRYNLKPMISWNSKLNFDNYRKRQYFQFIHNDGTRHNIPSPSSEEDEQDQKQQEDEKKERRLHNTISKAALTTPWLEMLEPTHREEILNKFKAGNKDPLIKSFRQFDSQRRRRIYQRLKTSKKETDLWWYRRTEAYEIRRDLIQAEMPLSQLMIDQWSLFFRPETVSEIKAEKLAHLRSQLLRLYDNRQLKDVSISDQRKKRKTLSAQLDLLKRNFQSQSK
jgi:hypothetical protein